MITETWGVLKSDLPEARRNVNNKNSLSVLTNMRSFFAFPLKHRFYRYTQRDIPFNMTCAMKLFLLVFLSFFMYFYIHSVIFQSFLIKDQSQQIGILNIKQPPSRIINVIEVPGM